MKITHRTPEEKRRYHLAWQRANKDKMTLYGRRWRNKNPNYQNEWNKSNPIKAKEISKKAYWKNRNQHLLNTKEWNQKNINRVKINREKNRKIHAFEEKVRYITHLNFENDKDKKCGICGSKDKLQFHHWIYKLPVERKHFSTLCSWCHGVQHTKGHLQ